MRQHQETSVAVGAAPRLAPSTSAHRPEQDLLVWVREWLGASVAHWAENGICPEGGAYEALDQNGTAVTDLDRRVRVQFRQIYVFAHAHELGLMRDGDDIAWEIFEYVWRRAWLTDGRFGWAHLLSADGYVKDPSRLAYDHAFALFACAWQYRVNKDGRALLTATHTLRFLDEAMRAPNGGWLSEAFVPNDRKRRLQNPHMHLFEACLALYEATGKELFLERANDIFTLFLTRFYDRSSNRLFEVFNEGWAPIGRNAGDIERLHAGEAPVEPGHMAEWSWLLSEHRRLSGRPCTGISAKLLRGAVRDGLDRSGRFLIDGVNGKGQPLIWSRRLWPQTELLRGALAEFRRTESQEARQLALDTIKAIKDQYLCEAIPGVWRDRYDAHGRLERGPAPASTFYHLFGAFSAALSILDVMPSKRSAPSATCGRLQ